MINRIQRAWQRVAKSAPVSSLHFDRPLVLFQSDDWGRVGVRDREGWEELKAAGVPLGEKPYDFYTLETAADLDALRATVGKHRDSVGRAPSLVMNFIMANVDFDRALASPQVTLPLIPLSIALPGNGLPSKWQRPGLVEAYQRGIRDGVFFPALHGLTHFCQNAILRELSLGGERASFIRKLWSAQTPYIHWRMPWIGYEYWDAEREPADRSLALDAQRSVIHDAAEIFQKFFQASPVSACAPGYRANHDTVTAWREVGVHVAQNGPGDRQAPFFDDHGTLHTFRTVEMEPATVPCDVALLLMQAEHCFHRRVPAVISIHSINFHSTIRDFRTPTLALLDQFLSTLEKKFPNLLYVHDADLFQIASEGSYLAAGHRIAVGVSIEAGKKEGKKQEEKRRA